MKIMKSVQKNYFEREHLSFYQSFGISFINSFSCFRPKKYKFSAKIHLMQRIVIRCPPILRDLRKTRLRLKFLHVESHFSPKKLGSTFSCKCESKVFRKKRSIDLKIH